MVSQPSSTGIKPPPILGEDHTAAFSSLSDVHPLLLLPVRMETRFAGSDLQVRIYPDQIHLDEHRPRLTAVEEKAGRTFWTRRLASTTDEERSATTTWLTQRISPRRAAWVALKSRPQTAANGDLLFPKLNLRETDDPAVALALPDRWAVAGWVNGEQRFVRFGAEVAANLGFAPKLADAVPWSDAEGALPVDEGMAWMVDYTKALDAGMAITVPLATDLLADIRRHGLTLLAIGVRDETAAASASTLESLLEAHLYTDGLEILRQGTPTNNTDEGIAGWTAEIDDSEDFFARELDGAFAATNIDAGAVRLARALGLDNAPFVRLPNGDALEETSARAMNRVLWPATWGAYLSDLLASETGASVVPGTAITTLRDWFVSNVRGGAQLPVIAIGPEPYGILPVRRTVAHDQMSSPFEMLEYTLLDLRERWRESLPGVPRLDPVLGDGIGTDPEDDVVTILGTLAHPDRFVVRRLTFQRSLRLFFWDWIWLELNDSGNPLHKIGDWYKEHEHQIHDIDSQIKMLDDLYDAIPALLKGPKLRDDARVVVDAMKSMAEAHQARQDPIQRLFPFQASGVFDDDVVSDPKLYWSGYGNATADRVFTNPLVEAENAGAGATAYDYLGVLQNRVPGLTGETTGTSGAIDLGGLSVPQFRRSPAARSITDVRAAARVKRQAGLPNSEGSAIPEPNLPGPATTGSSESGLSDAFFNAEPLLYQLLDKVVESVSTFEGLGYSNALATLRSVSVDELTLRLRETLGLATHRLDAWITGFARERLDALRADGAHPKGLQLGGFSWVEDLKPDKKGTRESQGFIHAPSLAHAATAAVLRAGYNAHGTGATDSTMAVDLRSNRIRLASYFLDGVRQGQPLGDLLGCRFERRLHDSLLDSFIEDCRRAVLASQGVSRTPRGPVDGLALADLYRGAGVAVNDGTTVLKPTSIPTTKALKSVKAALDDLLTCLDAVGDAAIADAVHHVLQGNRTRASATLDAISTGEVPPPELRSVLTAGTGVGIVHRLLIALGTEATSVLPWGTSARDRVEPALGSWCARCLGDPARVYASVSFGGDRPPPPMLITLADLVKSSGLSALDLVFDCPPGGLEGDNPWRRRIEAHVLANPAFANFEGVLAVDFAPENLPENGLTLAELAELARSLRALMAKGRPMDGRDLTMPGTEGILGWDVTDAEQRVDAEADLMTASIVALQDALRAGNASPPQPTADAALRAAMIALAAYAMPGAIPRVGWTTASRDQLYAEANALAKGARQRQDALNELIKNWSAVSKTIVADATRFERARQRLALVLSPGFPLLPRFTAPEPGPIAQSFKQSDTLLEHDSACALVWLARVAKVREPASLLYETLGLMELLLEDTLTLPVVAQLPLVAGEGWVANTAPANITQGRLCLFAIDHGGVAALSSARPLAGMVIDAWTEQISSNDIVTGVALHFDAPSSRAPQSLLLVVPPEKESWSFDLVVDSLLETLEAAKLRAVDPDILLAYGHQMPAIFPPGALAAGDQPMVQ
jgi:hypothetical protein